MPETESPCDFHCGYVSSGQDLLEHMSWEHRDCTECGAKAPERPYSLTHRLDCPRLRPGYRYPEPAPVAAGQQEGLGHGPDQDRPHP